MMGLDFAPGALTKTCAAAATRTVEVPITQSGDIQMLEVLSALARAGGVTLDRPGADLRLSTVGLARGLTKSLLADALGPEVEIAFRPGAMTLTIDDAILGRERRGDWLARLNELADKAEEAARRRQSYGMHALESYRPGNPGRPTICLVHGLNSSSGGFVHMIPWLQQAGFGIVVYDYPFNQRLEDSCASFARDWAAFRREHADGRPWAIVAHSMGALVARSLVESHAIPAHDVASLILIAPVNQGSQLAKVQTVVQLMNGLQAAGGKKTASAMAQLSDGLGAAANDLLPGSAFLRRLNSLPRRPGVRYHILAGDSGFVTREMRAQLETRIEVMTRNAGFFGKLAQAATADLPDLLDELTDGTGDGCVTVKRTRLDGVDDHVTIHANHAELIRAPILFADPGPVVSMPYILRWLRADR
jgi:pimeloyl-ACP methyl ester carboxylesterase